ncbi:type VI secretion-associated protein, VC_A0119 family [Desulfocurvibacter africanus PCS]|uniref:Type VI secretion-associated protein, VC_A0119 family n=1 Tax=Desulfocurvibacter africanus PCS TaxID=1262666 RepID=M5Q2A3_DESAF|nr:type VI secretion system protein TssA [Desulfocurvibacter africanus]EMG38276.1 type VI secretion-associated protein, VC_A0119 family [Desulfocurvibacter africanus PCS]
MELLDLGRQPVSAERPTGEDVRYEPDFEALQQEIDKLSGLSGPVGVDWNKVASLSSAILAGKSKNLLVAVYLAEALRQTRQLDGFMVGVRILGDLVNTFWDTLHPPKSRMKGRVNALAWWYERSNAFLTDLRPEPLPQETIDSLRAALRALDAFLLDKLDDGPIISRLIEYVDMLPVQAPPQASQANLANQTSPSEPAKTGSAPGSELPPTPSLGAGTAADLEKLLDFGLQQVGRVAAGLLVLDQADPLAYRLLRISAWASVTALPKAEAGKTLLPPPDQAARESLQRLAAAGDHAGVVQTVESNVPQSLFWLDLSRFAVQAFAALGDKYQAAMAAVRDETVSYIRRLPGIETLAFVDGTPFADRETRAWLKDAAGSASKEPAHPAGAGPEQEIAEALAEAAELFKKHKPAQALGLVHDGLVHAASARQRLLWRIALVELLSRTSAPEIARPHCREILRLMEEHRLEEWEPALALQGLSVVHGCLEDDGSEDSRLLAAEVMDKLARVGPAQALELLGKA